MENRKANDITIQSELGKAIYDIFMYQGVNYAKNEMDLDFITLELQKNRIEYQNADLNELRKKVSSYMARETTRIQNGKRVENKDSIFAHVKNKKGGYRKGVYTLRKPKRTRMEVPKPLIKPIEEPSDIQTLYLGSAGEMAVCSELLFREYNISRMAVDDGIDIIATKNNKTYYIQVKTATIRQESFSFNIKVSSFNKYQSNDCYYIFVARAKETKYIICTADDIRRFISNGSTKGEKIISVRFNQDMGALFVGQENVFHMVNSFERIM